MTAFIYDAGRTSRGRGKAATGAHPGIAPVKLAAVDLWELNEAFSSVVLLFLEQMALDPGRVNVNGGAIAMGHPLGATGAMIPGWGVAPYAGGVASCVDMVGAARVLALAERFAGEAGDRFAPPTLLRDMAAADRSSYGRAA